MDLQELIESRLDQHRNVFPQNLEVVRLWHPRSAKEFHDLGYLVGTAPVIRGSVRPDTIPVEITKEYRRLWKKTGTSSFGERGLQWLTIYWTLETPRGQEYNSTKANLVGVIDSKWGWDWNSKSGRGGYVLDHPGLEFEIGCKHVFVHKQLGRCYNEGRCAKCDYYYRVDSGD